MSYINQHSSTPLRMLNNINVTSLPQLIHVFFVVNKHSLTQTGEPYHYCSPAVILQKNALEFYLAYRPIMGKCPCCRQYQLSPGFASSVTRFEENVVHNP